MSRRNSFIRCKETWNSVIFPPRPVVWKLWPSQKAVTVKLCSLLSLVSWLQTHTHIYCVSFCISNKQILTIIISPSLSLLSLWACTRTSRVWGDYNIVVKNHALALFRSHSLALSLRRVLSLSLCLAMFSLQQVIKATAAANGSVGGGATDLYKFLRAATRGVTSSAEATTTTTNTAITQIHTQPQPKQSSQASSEFNFSDAVSHNSPAIAHGCCRSESESKSESAHDVKPTTAKQFVRNLLLQHSQDLQQQQQQRFIHSKCSSQDSAKSSQQQQQTTKFAMSSLAAEPLQAEISSADGVNTVAAGTEGSDATSGTACHEAASSAGKKPCFNTGLADILQFMELIGNLKVSTDTDWSRNPFLPQSLSPSFSSHRFFPRP